MSNMPNFGIHYDCKATGVCFNDKHRLKFGAFEKCWKRWLNGVLEASPIRPTDVDFLIEQRSNFLMMEWKDTHSVFNAHSGQGIMFRLLTARAPVSIILCEGSASDTVVRKLSVLSGRFDSGPMEASTETLLSILESWSRWSSVHPQPPTHTSDEEPRWLSKAL